MVESAIPTPARLPVLAHPGRRKHEQATAGPGPEGRPNPGPTNSARIPDSKNELIITAYRPER